MRPVITSGVKSNNIDFTLPSGQEIGLGAQFHLWNNVAAQTYLGVEQSLRRKPGWASIKADSIGFAHRRSWNPIPLVYDLMKPLRPVVDRKVLEFALAHTFTPGDFTISSKGGCRLNPQMAKAIAMQSLDLKCRPIIECFLRH